MRRVGALNDLKEDIFLLFEMSKSDSFEFYWTLIELVAAMNEHLFKCFVVPKLGCCNP